MQKGGRVLVLEGGGCYQLEQNSIRLVQQSLVQPHLLSSLF